MKKRPEELLELRARICTLQSAIEGHTQRGRSPAEVRAVTAAYLTEAEATGRRALGQRVADIADGDTAGGLLAGVGPQRDTAPLLVALLGVDTVLQALAPTLAALPPSLDAPARRERLKALRAELFAAEVEEERLVCEAEARGEAVLRRADADPAAVLYLPPAAAATARAA